MESCPADQSSGCLISRTRDTELYTRSCADTTTFECRDFQGDGEGEFIHECVCQGEGCNKDWGSAGEATTPDGVHRRVSFRYILTRIIVHHIASVMSAALLRVMPVVTLSLEQRLSASNPRIRVVL